MRISEQKIVNLQEKIAIRFMLSDIDSQLSTGNTSFLEIITHSMLFRLGYDYKIENSYIIVYNVLPIHINLVYNIING